MTRLFLFAAVLLGVVAAPPAVRVRINISAEAAEQVDAARIKWALQRGLYDDSLIVTGADSMFDMAAIKRSDPSWKLPHGQLVTVLGSVTSRGDTLDIPLRLMDILTHALVPPDTLHVLRPQLDSVLTDRGRKYARLMALKCR